jgi:hypothetical protein
MDDEALFAPWFAGSSWDGWRVVLRGAFGLPMTADEKSFFQSIADRDPPAKQVRELWICAGRRVHNSYPDLLGLKDFPGPTSLQGS